MVVLKGTIQNGQIVLPRPADLPDGTEVTVWPSGLGQTLGTPDDEWPTDPDGIARLLARMERVEPFDLTPKDESDTSSEAEGCSWPVQRYQH